MTRKDINEIAFSIVQRATGQAAPAKDERTPYQIAAAEFGRVGGKKGSIARNKALKPKRRRQIARKAAKARWSK